MSWINLNQSFNSLKGQITNFASEVLSESPAHNSADNSLQEDSSVIELDEKCRNQELEIASLKKSLEELQTSLQSERLSKKNGIKEEEASWYWDPPAQAASLSDGDLETHYKIQIRALQDELSSVKERDTVDLRPDQEIIRLREENKNLTLNLEDLDSQHQQAMERLLTLKKELQNNFEDLKQEHKDLKNTNDEYATEIKKLLAIVGERDKELEHIKGAKTDYDTLLHKYQNLERIHGLLRENAEKFQEENQDLHEEVFKLQEQVTKLEHDLEVTTKRSEQSDMVPRETYEEILKEVNELKDRRNSNQMHLEAINIDDNAKGVIESLKRDISGLKHQLTQKDSQENLDKLIKPEKIVQLYNKYVNFDLPIDFVGEIPSAGDNVVLFKLESVFKTLNSFKKEIDTLEHKLSEKNLNISHLQTQIDDLTTENDFLSTDIQHIERELGEMKKNNDFLISEIAALKNTSKLEPIIETHEDNLAKLESELADSNKMNKNFELEIRRIVKELDEVRSEKIALHDSLQDLKHKYTTMLSELDMFKNQSKAVEELEQSAKSQECEKLKKTVDEVDDLKKRLASANSKNEQLSIDIHILENDKVLLTKQVDDLKHALNEKSYAHKELEGLKSALDHKLNEFENKLDEVIKHKSDLETDKQTLQEKVKHLENELTSNSTVGNAELKAITTENGVLIEKLDQIVKDNITQSDAIKRLKDEIAELQRKQQDLLVENENLKKDPKTDNDIKLLNATIEELRAKTIHQDILNSEIISLKAENEKLLEKKVQLEAELSSTDGKIMHLEEEFEKLISDLNEKDTLIDSLNSTVEQNNVALQNASDLEKTVAIKNDEILRLTKSLEELTLNLKGTSLQSNHYQHELTKLHDEKEEVNKQNLILNDEINGKNSEISALTLRLEELERLCKEARAVIENKDKEIKELNQSIVELTDKIKTTDNTMHHNDEYAKVLQEKEAIEGKISDLHSSLEIKEKYIDELKKTHEQTEKIVSEYKTLIDSANKEKTELINLINLKHNESIQYHSEIQRLNHVILEQTNEFKKVIDEKDSLLRNTSANCTNCENLRITLKEKDEIIKTLNQNTSEYEKLKNELVSENETVRQLKERCENLDKNLATQTETVRRLTAENLQLSEQDQNSIRELERLRRHLVETEENYTQELMTSEQKLTECQARLHQVEERAKQTSTVYTSNSIRANQEVETYRNQIRLLEKQRDEVQARLSDAEDARGRSEAALTNLQVVLEQFQLEKERDVHTATEKIRNKMDEIRRENLTLQGEISRLNVKLEESLAGLQAATRLGDQVETKCAQINDLKEQVRTLQTSIAAAEERYYNAISNQQDKVDKNLVKNLVINYVVTAASNSTNKTQVLRVLSTVLDFNQQECEKLSLARSATVPDSLAAEFVKFLQNESRPRAPLPNMMTLTNASRSTTPTSRKNSTIGPSPNVPKPGHSRNPSNGSNNLLFQNIDTLDTASQRSRDSDREPRVVSPSLDTGVNQTRNTEGAILKSVLKDM